MSTQDLAAARNSRFMPTTGAAEPADFWGFAVRKRHHAGADAWWETVTDYIPAPWHPARAIAFGARKRPKTRRGRSRAALDS